VLKKWLRMPPPRKKLEVKKCWLMRLLRKAWIKGVIGAIVEVVKEVNYIHLLCCKKMGCRVILYLVREV
jgi:hypothetical protein